MQKSGVFFRAQLLQICNVYGGLGPFINKFSLKKTHLEQNV